MQCGLYRYKDRAWSQLASLSSHTDQVTCIAINSQDNLIATAAWDGRVCIWSAGDKKGNVELIPPCYNLANVLLDISAWKTLG